MMILIFIKQNLSNIWSSIMANLKNTEAVLKSVACKKRVHFTKLDPETGTQTLES